MISMKYTAIIHEAEEGGYWAEVPALPGCITEADTLDELKANILDAAQGWLDAQKALSFDYSIRPLRHPRLSSASVAVPRRAARRERAVLDDPADRNTARGVP